MNALKSLASMYTEEGKELLFGELSEASRRTMSKVYLYMDSPKFFSQMILNDNASDDTQPAPGGGGSGGKEAWQAEP